MRRRRPERRQILPDPVYNDKLVAKFVNYVMNCGKKGVAEKIFYGAMSQIKERTKTDGLEIFEKALLIFIILFILLYFVNNKLC